MYQERMKQAEVGKEERKPAAPTAGKEKIQHHKRVSEVITVRPDDQNDSGIRHGMPAYLPTEPILHKRFGNSMVSYKTSRNAVPIQLEKTETKKPVAVVSQKLKENQFDECFQEIFLIADYQKDVAEEKKKKTFEIDIVETKELHKKPEEYAAHLLEKRLN